MSKKISSGILLLIFSVVAVDLQASLKGSLNEKVAVAKEKIKKIELKDVLKYTVGAAVVTAVGVLAVVEHNKFQKSHKNTQQGIAGLNEETKKTQTIMQNVIKEIVDYVTKINTTLNTLATNRAKLLRAIKEKVGTDQEQQIVEVEQQTEAALFVADTANNNLKTKLNNLFRRKKQRTTEIDETEELEDAES